LNNVTARSCEKYRAVDSDLTPLGIKQAQNLRETFIHMNNITHILCSTLKRTRHTAQIAFEPLISQGLKIVAYHDLREHGVGLSSTGKQLGRVIEVASEGQPDRGPHIGTQGLGDQHRELRPRTEAWYKSEECQERVMETWC
jgi:broad specificity phosphatase PhoE